MTSPATPSPDSVVRLPPPRLDGTVSVERGLRERRSVREFRDEPLRIEDLGQILWAAQGVTGPEGQRSAPSAGALFPLELDVAAARVEGLEPGLYRYVPAWHALRRRAEGDLRRALAGAAHGQDWMRGAPAIILLSGSYRVIAARYGDRAPRYVHIEAGHAAGNLALQATALALGSVDVGAFDDDALRRAASLAPEEQPLLLLPIGRRR